MEIDLNADLGEGCGFDEALLDFVSSANIACGWHAGGANAMRDCVRWAVEKGVAIGAHPSFNDPENFGRKEMDLPAGDIYAGVLYQLGALSAIAQAEGGRIVHVKPHGALYNQAARDPAIADAIVSAVHDFDPSVAVFGLANSSFVDAARRARRSRGGVCRPRLPLRRLARAAQPARRDDRRRRRNARAHAHDGARPESESDRRQVGAAQRPDDLPARRRPT